MITFSDFTNQEKVCFLLDVLEWYLKTHQNDVAVGLCHAVRIAAHQRGFIWVGETQDFMGAGIWNPTYAGSQVKNPYAFWWPTDDVISRVKFINKLIRLYNV